MNMDPILAIALGLEVQRFSAHNDTADALSTSLDALQSGAWTLSPYSGPAIQPVLTLERGPLAFGLAPAASWRRSEALAADGREGTLSVQQWRVEARLYWQQGPLRLGLDGGYSSGSATINDEIIAEATQVVHIAPSAGLQVTLTEELSLIGRVLWPVSILDEALEHGPRGALGLEWRP